MHINYINQSEAAQWDQFESYLEPLLRKTLTKLNHSKDVEVSIVMVKNEVIQGYNRNYRNIDKATDVLSFEDGSIEDDICMLGDIIISVDKVVAQAKDYGHSIDREFCFLVVHGYLHLLGYDHQNEEEERVMIHLQKEILDGIAERDTH